MSLQESLNSLAESFASQVIDLIRNSGESSAPPRVVKTPRTSSRAIKAPKAKTGRLPRRSPEQIARAVADVAALLKKHPMGLRSEEIKTILALDVREVPSILKHGIADKAFSILSGAKRSTTYGIKKGKPATKPAKKPAATKSAAKTVKKAAKVVKAKKPVKAKNR